MEEALDKLKVEVGADIDMVLFGSGIMVTTTLPKVLFLHPESLLCLTYYSSWG